MFGDSPVEVQQIDTLTASNAVTFARSIGTDNLPQKAAPSAKKYAKKVTFNMPKTVPAMSTCMINTNELPLRVGGGAPLFSEDIAALPENFDISFGNFPDKLKHIFANPPPHAAAADSPTNVNLNANNSVPATQSDIVVNTPPKEVEAGRKVLTDDIQAPTPAIVNLPLQYIVPATQSIVVANPSPQEATVGEQVNICAPTFTYGATGEELGTSLYWYWNTVSAAKTPNGETLSGYTFVPITYQIASAEEFQKELMPSNVFGSSYLPYQGCKCIEMRSRAQELSKQFDGVSAWNRMSTLSASAPRYDDTQHHGATGNMDCFVAEGIKPMMKNPYKCNFCANNQEEDIFHQLKSETGEVLCPILREVICKICGATQANAHTPKYCPQNHRNRREPMTWDRHFPPLQKMNSFGNMNFVDNDSIKC